MTLDLSLVTWHNGFTVGSHPTRGEADMAKKFKNGDNVWLAIMGKRIPAKFISHGDNVHWVRVMESGALRSAHPAAVTPQGAWEG